MVGYGAQTRNHVYSIVIVRLSPQACSFAPQWLKKLVRKARRLFAELRLFRKPRYPPWRVAAYEPAQHIIVILAILYLLSVAEDP